MSQNYIENNAKSSPAENVGNEDIERNRRFLSAEEWSKLTSEEQLIHDPDRVLIELAVDEQNYAMSKAYQEREETLLEEAQITPSRAPSPDVTGEMKEIVEEEESSEINEHMEGHEFKPQPIKYSKKTHRLPQNLVGVKSKYWFGTHNDAEYLDIDELEEVCFENREDIEWVVMFKEIAPTTGHEHFHSLVVFKKPKQAHTCIDLDPRGSWEKVRGQLKTAYNYIRKDNNKYFEYGRLPDTIYAMLEAEERKSRKQKAPTKTEIAWREIVTRAKQGDETIRNEMIYARFRPYFDDILASVHKNERYDGDLQAKNLWIQGPPGTGKSRLVWDYAEQNNLDIYVKLQNKWWDGFNRQKIVLIDDAGENMKMLASHIKNWADRYPFTAEVKGGSRRINASEFYFIVTSNYSIREIFNATDAEAIERRFDVLEMK